jgi:hypothetical protein
VRDNEERDGLASASSTCEASRVPPPGTSTAKNRTAFSKADVPDAKRGFPDFDLRDYAAWRDLEFLDHGTPAGFRAAVPCEAELQSNVMRGRLPGGAWGILAHEGLEVGWTDESPDWGGTFYGTRVTARGDTGGLLAFVPVVNWFVGSAAAATARIPVTLAATRVPETVGALTHLRIDRRRSAPPFSFGNRTKLDELVGEKGWALYARDRPGSDLVARLVGEPVAELLREHTDDGLFQAVVWWGTLVVRRNGFLRSFEELDELERATSLLAGRLREVCLALADRRPFEARLPRPPPRSGLDAPPGFLVEEAWSRWAAEVGARYGLQSEDPLVYHRAFPSLPVPGVACVVLNGTLPRLNVPGRLVVHREREAARPAILLKAPLGIEPTPPGGTAHPEHGVWVEVADGLIAVWSVPSYWGSAMAGDIDAFCSSAAAAVVRMIAQSRGSGQS